MFLKRSEYGFLYFFHIFYFLSNFVGFFCIFCAKTLAKHKYTVIHRYSHLPTGIRGEYFYGEPSRFVSSQRDSPLDRKWEGIPVGCRQVLFTSHRNLRGIFLRGAVPTWFLPTWLPSHLRSRFEKTSLLRFFFLKEQRGGFRLWIANESGTPLGACRYEPTSTCNWVGSWFFFERAVRFFQIFTVTKRGITTGAENPHRNWEGDSGRRADFFKNRPYG